MSDLYKESYRAEDWFSQDYKLFLSLSLLVVLSNTYHTGFECIWTSLTIHDDKLYFHFSACADFLLALNKAKTYMDQNVQSKSTLQPFDKLCSLCFLITDN